MRQNTKEFVIGEQRYQIARMDARTGSWIAMQLLTKLFPFNMEAMMGLDVSKLPANRTELTETEFHNIQDHCLKVVARFDTVGTGTVPIPVLMKSGVWSFKDLETDVVTVLALTAQSLVFNIGPFFDEGALKPLLESLSGLSQFSAPKI
jgi:hypothetical protein